MPFFNLSTGLRGCYMPDSASVIRTMTRKSLRDHIESETEHLKEVGYVGLSKKAITQFITEAWARRNDPRWTMDLVLPYGTRENSRAFGIFLSRSNVTDYNTWLREND